jgi:hypothetical protein
MLPSLLTCTNAAGWQRRTPLSTSPRCGSSEECPSKSRPRHRNCYSRHQHQDSFGLELGRPICYAHMYISTKGEVEHVEIAKSPIASALLLKIKGLTFVFAVLFAACSVSLSLQSSSFAPWSRTVVLR